MKRLIVFSPLFLLFAVFLFNTAKAPAIPQSVVQKISPTPTPQPFNEDKLWSLIQKWRTDNGFQPYIKDQRLCVIAEDRVTNDAPLDEHAGLYRKYSNYPYVIQENLAAYQTAEDMLQKWLGSVGHSATLHKPYAYSCIACRPLKPNENLLKGLTYCSQIFSNF